MTIMTAPLRHNMPAAFASASADSIKRFLCFELRFIFVFALAGAGDGGSTAVYSLCVRCMCCAHSSPSPMRSIRVMREAPLASAARALGYFQPDHL